MTGEQMRDLVKECGLDWHRGYMPLFDNDPTNRYAVLIEAVEAAERERRDAETVRLREAIERVERVMGPKVPPCCTGCEQEWNEALSTAREALAPPAAPPKDKP